MHRGPFNTVYFLSSALPSQDDNIDLHYAVPVGGMTSIECGIKQGALGEFYTPRWYQYGFSFREIDVHTVDSGLKSIVGYWKILH